MTLADLLKKRPTRMGRRTPNGWNGEPDGSYNARLAAWEAAVARAKEADKA